MDQAVAISTDHLTKAYRIWSDPARRLTSPILTEASRWMPPAISRRMQDRARAGYRDFFALKDVSFEVKRGEAVGIIGRNGAGKSTLLQIIAGTLQPSAGTVQINGRVAALLELGAGFNPDFTGRENVFLSGAVLGLGKAEMESRFDDVAAFADIGDFLDQPVKTYSSGMTMRLAFAVNTCVDPDILIVDEALSVGDAPFQAKCFRRLRQLIDKGVSLLFVSHDIGTVRSICTRALWLKAGHPEKWGEAKEVAREYEKFCWQEQGIALAPESPTGANPASTVGSPAGKTGPDGTSPAVAATVMNEDTPHAQLVRDYNFLAAQYPSNIRYGTGTVLIDRMTVINASGRPTRIFEFNEPVTFLYALRAVEAVDTDFIVGIRVRDPKGNFVYTTQDTMKVHRLKLGVGQSCLLSLTTALPLTHADYLIQTAIFGYREGSCLTGGRYDFSKAILWDVLEEAFAVTIQPHKVMPMVGPAQGHAEVKISDLSDSDQPSAS